VLFPAATGINGNCGNDSRLFVWCHGIENRTIDNSAAYLAGWLANGANRKPIINAAAPSERACDYILDVKN
jgi:hypothetical protein